MAMTQKAFNETVGHLIEVFGDRKFSAYRIKVLWDSINDLDDQWFQVFAKRMIAEYNDSLNIVDAARGERRSRADIERTNRALLSSQQSDPETGKTLQDVLAEMGVKSVGELFGKKPSNQAGEEEQK